MKTAVEIIRRNIFLLGFLMFILNPVFAQEPEFMPPENEQKTHYLLGIIGYNYTDRAIDRFSVNGQSGGDIGVSSPTSGGGGTVCCVLFPKTHKWPVQVLVRWQSGGCRVWDKGRKSGHNRYFYKEKIVNLENGTKTYPFYLEAHFFKNDEVRVRIVNDSEPPLLQLPEERAVDEYFSECRAGAPTEDF